MNEDNIWARVPLAERLKLAESIKTNHLFARRFLRSDPWQKQVEIMESVQKPNSRTNVKACHASGKTWVAATCGLAFLARYKEAIVITTAPTDKQVRSILWPEIHSAIDRGVYPFPKPLQTELKLGPKRYAIGFTTSVTKQDEGVKFQGFHAEHILFILDEAPGVDPRIMAAIEGARAGGDVRILGLGNPTIAGGPFYDSFHNNRSTWNTFTISAFDTPNFQGCSLTWKDTATGEMVTVGEGKDLMEMTEEELHDNPRPYLTTRYWVKEKFIEWGPDSPLFEARVLGNFPKNNEFSLVPLAMVEACNRVVPVIRDDAKLHAGIDVAGPGDAESVLTVRQDTKIIFHKGYTTKDPRGEILSDLASLGNKERYESVNVDSIGIGYNFALHIRDEGYPVNMINIQEAVDPETQNAERYFDKKAHYYWHLREQFQANQIHGLTDETAMGQITTIRYYHDAKGRIKIESKDDMARRGVKSPDRAESIMLAYCPANTAWSGLMDFYRATVPVVTVPKSYPVGAVVGPLKVPYMVGQ